MANERTRLWSQEVKEADPMPEDKTVYTFSNGRRFTDTGTSNNAPYRPIEPATNE